MSERQSNENERSRPSITSTTSVSQQTATDDAIVRLVIISDTHGQHDRLDPYLQNTKGDVLIHCGDFADRGDLQQIRSFRQWLEAKTQFPEKLVIAGNHDRDLKHPNRIDLAREFRQSHGVTLLNDEVKLCAGGRLHVFGASWETCEHDTFHLFRHILCPAEDSDEPPIDVLLSHVPPALPVNVSSAWNWIGQRSGSLTDVVLQGNIPLCASGHLHWGRGAVRVFHDKNEVGERCGQRRESCSVFVNASSIQSSANQNSSRATYCSPPVVVDYNVRHRCIVQMDGLEYLQDARNQLARNGTGTRWEEVE